MKLWGGRFEDGPADTLAALSRSVHFDWRLAPYDIDASLAHAQVLLRAGLLSEEECHKLSDTLRALRHEITAGELQPEAEDEDVHTALERELVTRLDDLGGKLRAGRSRNDQIATDLRLYLLDAGRRIEEHLTQLAHALLTQAELYPDAVLPGMTHLQHAQPVLLAHHLAAHIHPLVRDKERLQQWSERSNVSPLGAGALAGSSLRLDPEQIAGDLSFHSAAHNSIDAVSDRDFVAEFCFIAAMIGVHLSRLSEEIILWSTSEFGWVELHDRYTTGSSIMPQKKNSDAAELARGKTGRLVGNLTAVLSMLKGLPLAYNRDLQEDKEPAFDAVDTLELVLPVMTGMVSTWTLNTEAMAQAAPEGFTLATEIAEWLVHRGVPFRRAHDIVGHAVTLAARSSRGLHELSDKELVGISEHLTPEVRHVLDISATIAARTTPGSTGAGPVKRQLEDLRAQLAHS